jgi:hypothetical protein
MNLSQEELNILSDLTNDTFGYSSTEDLYGEDRLGGYYPIKQNTSSTTVIKYEFQGDTLIVKCIAVINLGMIGQQHQQIAAAENELNQRIKNAVSELKKRFKKQSGKTLKANIIKGSENTSISDINPYAETRRSYVQRSIAYKLG